MLFYSIAVANSVAAQQHADSSRQGLASTPIKQPAYDVGDFFRKVFHNKQQLASDSSKSKTKSVYVTVLPVAGYSLQTGLAASLTSGVAFSMGTAAGQKVSNLLTNITYTQYHQVLFPFAVNMWTRNNKFNIVLDYRFLKYPSTNYGLGAYTTESDAYTIDYKYIKLHQSVLKELRRNFYGGIGFYYDHFWNVTEVDPPAGIKTSFEKYGAKANETAAGLAFKLLFDSRTNQVNPSNGYYANIVYRPNFTFLGSDNNWQALQMECRKYINLSGRRSNTLALWSYNWLTLGKSKQPYLSLPSTGWDDQYNTGRGYIQSRFRAKQMIYAEAEYRFGITNNGFLGAVVFANAQSFSKNISNQLNVIAPGIGTGLRIKLNKNSNTNLCVDYGFGLNGSKGLFLNLGEVF